MAKPIKTQPLKQQNNDLPSPTLSL